MFIVQTYDGTPSTEISYATKSKRPKMPLGYKISTNINLQQNSFFNFLPRNIMKSKKKATLIISFYFVLHGDNVSTRNSFIKVMNNFTVNKMLSRIRHMFYSSHKMRLMKVASDSESTDRRLD